MVVVNVGHEYMDGTRGSGIVSSADDVLEINVMRSWWSAQDDWIWALLIQWKQGKCVCVWVTAVWPLLNECGCDTMLVWLW